MKTNLPYWKYGRPLLAACILLSASTKEFQLSAHPEGGMNELPAVTQQQGIVVTGIVQDATGFALPGVNVVEKGSTNGTMSDMDGKFTLTVSGSKSVIQISYVGFQTQEIPVGTKKSFTVKLMEDSQLVDEVIVIGYGTQKKGDVTSAISSVFLTLS